MKLTNFWYHQTKRESLGLMFDILIRKSSSSIDKDVNICSLGFINGDLPSDRIILLFEITLFSLEVLLEILYDVLINFITLSRVSNATWAVLEFSVQRTWQKSLEIWFTCYFYEFTPSSWSILKKSIQWFEQLINFPTRMFITICKCASDDMLATRSLRQ